MNIHTIIAENDFLRTDNAMTLFEYKIKSR